MLISVNGLFASSGYSQSARVSLEMENTQVKNVLAEIERTSEFYFLYSNRLIDVDRKVNIHADNHQIGEILDGLFSSSDVEYVVIDRQIILSPGKHLADIKMKLQPVTITGTVTNQSGDPLPGVNVVIKGTNQGNITNSNGEYSVEGVPEDATLVYSYVGMITQEIPVRGQTNIDVVLKEATLDIDEVIVVGYGTQKKSDITGTVASVSRERLENFPSWNVAQTIQGAVAGVMIQTSAFGAAPVENILIRGRNSIKASNTPLFVVDGIPYYGEIRDLNTNDIASIEVLKDASAAAIYGSRGSNGVVLITTKEGTTKKTTVSYGLKFDILNATNLPDMLTGPEWYDWKVERNASAIVESEQAVYDAGTWVDWQDLCFRQGSSQEHNLSVTGGIGNTTYYIGAGFLDVNGIAVNDDYRRLSTRVNLETQVFDWLAVGTNTNLSLNDLSGASIRFDVWGGGVWSAVPLTTPYDENGNLSIYIRPESQDGNPLQGTLFDDVDKSRQILSNNYAVITFPFVKGLTYRINTGLRYRFVDQATYAGRDTKLGVDHRGYAETARANFQNTTVDNIISYRREFDKHNIFATALYSYEGEEFSSNGLSAEIFPNDVLSWYASSQAELKIPEYKYSQTNLISQMLRLNYGYDSRYLVTLTVRRDGYSGFGANKKWGTFPSVAVAWNLVNEGFFPMKEIFSNLKLRGSFGLNGNQAIGAYESISRLTEEDMVSGATTVPGFKPSVLGQDDLGWEYSRTLNLGMDFGILKNRIMGDFNWYRTNTYDLLLSRTISAVHGITTITQNIGETYNLGLEFSLNSRNITTQNFKWNTQGNFSFNKNRIVALYGLKDEEGNELDDVVNAWFIGEPIRVNYDYVWDGVWQLDEAEEASVWRQQPGYAKLKDLNSDGSLSAEDRQIQGQRDPIFIWGMTNSFMFQNFTLSIFMHGMHGITKLNPLMRDNVAREVRTNTMKKNWWTPDNPTNDFYMNADQAKYMSGIEALFYENASFIRIKDISLSYNLPKSLINRARISNLRLFISGRNLFTFTEYRGMDPELDEQNYYPLQKEYVFGIDVEF